MSTYQFVLQISEQRVTSRLSNVSLEADFALKGKRLAKIRSLTERLKIGEKELGLIELESLGENLFEALLNGAILEKFRELYEKVAQPGEDLLRLELIFSSSATWIAELPWEFLRVPQAYRVPTLEPYLAVSGRVTLVRSVPNLPAIKIRLVGPAEKLRVGVAISNPKHWENLEQELGPIDPQPVLERLGELQETHSSLFPIEHKQVLASKSMIRTLLSSYEPYILHFIGHGDVIQAYGGSLLFLIDDETISWEEFLSALPVRGDELCALFDSQNKPTVVILQSCNTARGGSPAAYSSLAAKLAKAGIPLVVAFQYEMQNKTASEFGMKLYKALADGVSLEVAVNQARLYLFDLAIDRGFGTPVVYVTTSESHLFSRTVREAFLDTVAEHLLALPGIEEVELSMIAEIYRSCIEEKTTYIEPLSNTQGGLRKWVLHLTQATPAPGKSRPLAYFAATLADRVIHSQKPLAEALRVWLRENAEELSVDPENLKSLILPNPQEMDSPYLQVILKTYLGQMNFDPKNQQYILITRDGRYDKLLSFDEKVKWVELPSKVIAALHDMKLSAKEAARLKDLVWIEFCLPTSYLSSRVEQWPALEKGKTLGQLYKVVVRSHYRWENRSTTSLESTWPNKWNACYEALRNLPTIVLPRVITESTLSTIADVIDDAQVVGLAFEPRDGLPVGNLLTILLDSGVPVAVWVRQGTDIQVAAKWLEEQIGKNLDLRHLAEHIRQIRNDPTSELNKALVLLWDNYDHGLGIQDSFEAPTFQDQDVPF